MKTQNIADESAAGNTPVALPDIKTAQLPALYEAAKTALAQCATIDECRTWADRMAALASYGKQSEDEALMSHAMRIRARAIDRCGELLREIRPDKPGPKLGTVAGTEFGRMQAAAEAGLSKRKAITALRVNNVPREQFEAMVEAANPPTVTELARLGTRHRELVLPPHLKGRHPADFQEATSLIGFLRRISQDVAKMDLDAAVRGLDEEELAQAIKDLDNGFTALEEINDALQRK